MLMTGLIGMSGLCSFSRAFTVGGGGFFWIMCFILGLSIIRLHCWKALCISAWNLFVGSLVRIALHFLLQVYFLIVS